MPQDNLTRLEAEQRAKQVSNAKYEVFLDVSTATIEGVAGDTFVSRSKITFDYTAVDGFDVSPLFVDLKARNVESVILNGTELGGSSFAEHRITLPSHVLQSSNELTVVANCAFTNTGEGLHKYVSKEPEDAGEVYLYTQFEVADARRAFACFEQPDIKATFLFTVRAPEGWQVTSTQPTPTAVSNGDGTATWSFGITPVMSTYLTSLCAGNFAVWEDSLVNSDGRTIPLRIFARKSMQNYLDAENIFRTTKQGFDFYAKLFKVPYAYDKYDQVFMPQFNAGAMENIGNVTFREDYIFRSKVPDAVIERRVTTILHELAHMWFGDLVTMKWWNDLWLNESFAEYVSTLAGVEATEENARGWVGFNVQEKAWGAGQDQLPSTHPIVADIKDLNDVLVNFDGITYAKGAAALQALVNYAGRDKFFKGIENYLNKHAFKNATLDNLLDELEATSGKDLRSWSAAWLETAGINTLKPVFEVDAAGKVTKFEIHQSAAEGYPTLRPHAISIGFYDFTDGSDSAADNETKNVTATGSLSLRGAKLRVVDRVEIDVLPQVVTEVPKLVGKTKPAFILLNDQGQTFAKIRLDETSEEVALNYVHKVADPLTRALLIDVLWNECRDALLSPNDFIDVIFKAIASETESITIRRSMQYLRTAVFLYVSTANRAQVIKGVGTNLWELAREAAPGSDAQLQFFDAFCNFASTGDSISILQGVLKGDIHLPGLEVDLGLAWEIRKALARLGVLDKASIIIARDADLSEHSTLAARYAFAAIPTVEAKQAAFDLAFGRHSDVPNAELEQLGGGFTQVTDSALLKGFGFQYYDLINDVWDNKDFAVAENIIRGFYPAHLANLELAQLGEKWLDENEKRPAALRRIVSENLDGTRRALRVHRAGK